MLFIGCLFFLSGCVTAKQKLLDQGMTPLDNVAYEEILSKPIKFKLKDLKYNENSTLEYSPDGTQKFDNGQFTDEGWWRIENNEYCSKWKKIRNGAERCYTWFKVEENTYEVFYPDGSKSGIMTID